MKNQGISLISLIITIIVIIILAAIVIFNGLNAPNSANFAGFTQQVDNVQMAVQNKHGDLKVKHSISGDYRTDEQIYIEIANAADCGQYATMNTTSVNAEGIKNSTEGTGVQNIVEANSNLKSDNANYKYTLGMTLPKVRQSAKAWYVTKDGKVFNANGYTYDGKTYFTGSVYTEKEINAVDSTNGTRAEKIGEVITADTNIVAKDDIS